MPNRVIKSTAHAANQALGDALASLFALEVFSPSKSIYLISPWVSDFILLDNAFGQFRVLLPDGNEQVRLSTVLNALAEQGSIIYVLTRPNPNQEFMARLRSGINRKVWANLHEKSLLTDHFYLRGSMNFTFSGVNRNNEHVELSTEPADIAMARVTAQALWQGVPA